MGRNFSFSKYKNSHFIKIFAAIFLIFCVSLNFSKIFAQENFYWDEVYLITEKNLDSNFPKTVTNGPDSFLIWQEADPEKKEIFLNLRYYEDLKNYRENLHFAGPFTYSGEVPDIYSVAINKKGTLVIAVSDGLYGISIFTSYDSGKNFSKNKLTENTLDVAPRVFVNSNDQFVLFTSMTSENAFRLNYSVSPDGRRWPALQIFGPSASATNPFLPVLVGADGRDYVAFQSQFTGTDSKIFSYQVYLTSKSADENEWSDPLLLTDNLSFKKRPAKDFSNFQSQVPVLFNYNDSVYLAWERSENRINKIYAAQINKNGIITKSLAEMNTRGARAAFFEYKNKLYLTWSDGATSVFAEKNGNVWKETKLPAVNAQKIFSNPLVIKSKKSQKEYLNFVFQNKNPDAESKNYISVLGPDVSVSKPSFSALSYTEGQRSSSKKVQIKINFPHDTSGIKSYSYVWSQNSQSVPEISGDAQKSTATAENPEILSSGTGGLSDSKITVNADFQDGFYYLTAKVQDNAGNWSEPATIVYERDTTPPVSPQFNFTNLDEYGFVKSNTYRLSWLPSADDDTDGYTWRIDYLGSIPSKLAVNSRHSMKLNRSQIDSEIKKLQKKYQNSLNSKRKMSSTPDTRGLQTSKFTNSPNGVYALSVAAIDKCGNVGKPNVKLFILNKYEPHTLVSESNFQLKTDDLGRQFLTLHGSGFTYEGTISEIFIDRDGNAPYDLSLYASNNDFRVVNDTLIEDVKIGSELDEGSYCVILNHTDRGLCKTGNFLKIDQNGTLKIESPYEAQKHFSQDFRQYKHKLSVYIIVLALILIFGALIIAMIFVNLNKSVYNSSLLKLEIKSLMTGEPMPAQKIKEKNENGGRRHSLRTKLMAFTLLLIVFVVASVTIITGYRNIRQQQQTLTEALYDRTQLLMESLNTSVNNFLPNTSSASERELRRLPAQKTALEEAKYITIMGEKLNSTANSSDGQGSNQNKNALSYYISSNDPEILSKINTPQPQFRISEITDKTLCEIAQKMQLLDSQIKNDEEVKRLSQEINNPSVREENFSTTQAYEEFLDEYDKNMRDNLSSLLTSYSTQNFSQIPDFDAFNLHSENDSYEYIFYRPVIYYSRSTDSYVHAVIIINLSVESLIQNLQKEVVNILFRSIIVALVTVILGAAGAFILSSMIVRPIRQLEKHVIKIGLARKKKDIKEIKIRSKDEIGRLGDAVNKMTEELKANEIEQNLLLDGADVQNSLTPLQKEETYSDFEDDNIKASGYYQAQTGVSGDYFDYHKLDDEWYSFIKSDASGHGAPAAIIATGVAVIYREYFDKWTFKKDGIKINALVERINDFINNWHLRGKFATLLVGIFNCKTGDAYVCNAGDNLVRIYKQKESVVKTIKLKETPTAGPFDTEMVNMKGGFIVEKIHLEKGDILFLYTDGIEESSRKLRFEDFSVQQVEEKVMQKNPQTGRPQEVIKKIDKKEEFGAQRVQKIIEDFYNRKIFLLQKEQNPLKDEKLEFDFSKCETNLHNLIFALASAEKVFRMYKPKITEKSEYITVDKNIDLFLQKCFSLYQQYALQKEPSPDKRNFFDYFSVCEDEQGDDLTLLAIQRK